MTNAALFLGRFFLDRRGARPRILEVRDYLEGVYLVTDSPTHHLLSEEALSEHIGDVFPSRDRAERALGQVMMSIESRAVAEQSTAVIEPAGPSPDSESDDAEEPTPVAEEGAQPTVQHATPRNDPAFVDLVSAVLSLPPDHVRILEAMVAHPTYVMRKFTEGRLAGHDVAAINLMEAQVAAGVDYPVLVDAIVQMKKTSLLEVVRDALPAGQPELASFWIVVNPDCIDVLASGSSPIGLVA